MNRSRTLILASVTLAVLFGALPWAANAQQLYSFVSNSGSGTVSVIETNTGTVVKTIPVGSDPREPVPGNGTWIYVPNAGSNSVTVIDSANLEVLTTFTHASLSQPVDIGISLYTGEGWILNRGNNTITVIDTSDNSYIRTESNGCLNQPSAIVMGGGQEYVVDDEDSEGDPNDPRIGVVNGGTNSVCIFKEVDGSFVTSVTVGSGAPGAAEAVNCDDRILFGHPVDQKLYLVDPGYSGFPPAVFDLVPADPNEVGFDLSGLGTPAGLSDLAYLRNASFANFSEYVFVAVGNASVARIYRPCSTSIATAGTLAFSGSGIATKGVTLDQSRDRGFVSDSSGGRVFAFDLGDLTETGGSFPISGLSSPGALTTPPIGAVSKTVLNNAGQYAYELKGGRGRGGARFMMRDTDGHHYVIAGNASLETYGMPLPFFDINDNGLVAYRESKSNSLMTAGIGSPPTKIAGPGDVADPNTPIAYTILNSGDSGIQPFVRINNAGQVLFEAGGTDSPVGRYVRFTPPNTLEQMVYPGMSVAGSTISNIEAEDGLSRPVMNENGHVAAAVRLADGRDAVLFVRDPADFDVVALTGSAGPFGPSVLDPNSPGLWRELESVVDLNDMDQVLFKGTIAPAALSQVYSQDHLVLWSDSTNTHQRVAATGDALSSGDYLEGVAVMYDVNNQGHVVYKGGVTDADVVDPTPTNIICGASFPVSDTCSPSFSFECPVMLYLPGRPCVQEQATAIFFWDGAITTEVHRADFSFAAKPGIPSIQSVGTLDSYAFVAMNNNDKVFVVGGFDGYEADAVDKGIFTWEPGDPSVTEALRTGDVIDGRIVGSIGVFADFFKRHINDNGDFAITASFDHENLAFDNDVSGTNPDPNVDSEGDLSRIFFTGAQVLCPIAPTPIYPVNLSGLSTSGTLSWTNVDADSYNVYLQVDSPIARCTTLFGNTTSTNTPFTGLQPGTTYRWAVEAVKAGCPVAKSACVPFRTKQVCPTAGPTLLAPENGTSESSPVVFMWSAVPNAISYTVKAALGNGPTFTVGTTTSTMLQGEVPGGNINWFVEAAFPSCPPVRSLPGSFVSVCDPIEGAPLPSLVSEETTGETYTFSWRPVSGATSYQVWESTRASFDNPEDSQDPMTFQVNGLSMDFVHDLIDDTPVAYYYRVRGFSSCTNSFSEFSQTMRVVIVPEPDPTNPSPSVTTQFGNDEDLIVEIDICLDDDDQIVICPAPIESASIDAAAEGTGSVTFTTSSSVPFMTVSPPTGTVTSSGTTLTVTVTPSGLNNGTHTGTVTATSTTSATNQLSTPVSVSLVTPVVPLPKNAPTEDSLIVLASAHSPGLNSQWQSDVRMSNIGGEPADFLLTFTKSGEDGTLSGSQTSLNASAGETIALNDMVKTWYGLGSLPGENATGVIDISPDSEASAAAKDRDASFVPLASVIASSRTYNTTLTGTFGQFIPAVPFGEFVGMTTSGSTVLSLQQVKQNSSFRTNLGLVEASGAAVRVAIDVYRNDGQILTSFSQNLPASSQIQLDSVLATHGVTLDDGRIEISVLEGDGKIYGYASVVDNGTNDPTLIPAANVAAVSASRYVLAGVADYTNERNHWRSDVRIYNSGSADVSATVTFYPQGASESPLSKQISVPAGQVVMLDNVLETEFGVKNSGGALHVTTGSASSLIVTGRTYDVQAAGTYGQYLPGMTSSQAVGASDRAMHVLQLEQTDQFRSNVGLAEVTGNPATVQVTAIAPNSLSAPSTTITLKANEFIQLVRVLEALGLSEVYNGTIMVKTVSGTGKVTTYGSVIDNRTQDPTYVPGQ